MAQPKQESREWLARLIVRTNAYLRILRQEQEQAVKQPKPSAPKRWIDTSTAQ